MRVVFGRDLGIYVAVVAAGLAASWFVLHGEGLSLDASPLVGDWGSPRWLRVLPAALVASVVVWVGPSSGRRLSWSALVVASGLSAMAWGVALALVDGWDRLTAPLTTRYEYEPFAASITDVSDFVRTFATDLPGYPVHVQGHPPGAPLLARALDEIGLGGAGWLAALVVLAWGLAIVAVLDGVRLTSGEATARRAAPALVVLPAAVWAVTSMDAVFAAVLALGIALGVRDRRSTAVAAGLVLGTALLGTYGGVVLAAVPIGVQLLRGRRQQAALIGVGIAVVLIGMWALTGFWWLDGLAATREVYWAGIAAERPSAFLTLVGNPTALAVALGPAGAVGLARALRHPRELVVPAGVALAVLAADLSLLSKGEVERIWLPFAVWLAAGAPGDDRRWLAAQGAAAVGLQAVLRTPW